MLDNSSQDRLKHFAKYRLLWLAIHHFLPAKLLHEFAESFVATTSGGALSLGMLFESQVTAEEGSLASWVIAPRDVEAGLAGALQHVVRIIGWQSDADPLWHSDALSATDREKMEEIEAAMAFARVDLESGAADLDHLAVGGDEGVRLLKSSIVALKNNLGNDSEWEKFFEQVSRSLAMPLSGTLLKHLGDLCADGDRWLDARRLYQRSEAMFDAFDQTVWDSLSTPLKVILKQSKATAAQMIDGPKYMADELGSLVESTTLASGPLLRLNMGSDALFSQLRSSDALRIPPDHRAAILPAPLRISARNLTGAFDHWARGSHLEAIQRFWAVLRRQIALGSSIESRTTKAHYAKCLIESLSESLTKSVSPVWFSMGMRLLVESGDVKLSDRVRWSTGLIATYVSYNVVEELIAHISHAPGFRIERSLVLISIFERWLVDLPPESLEAARRMMSFLAEVARDNSWSLFGDRNIPGAALEALGKVAKRRPEWRSLSSISVIEAAKKQLADRHLAAVTAVFDTVSAYLDAFNSQERLGAIQVVLDYLDPLPKSAPWAITNRAINILTSETCSELSMEDPALGERIVSAILKFGLADEGQKSMLLFYLRKFPASVIERQVRVDDLKGIVDDIRRQLSTGSSETTNNILALLDSPDAAGADGVEDALTALANLIRSVELNHDAFSFPFAYEPLLALTRREDALSRVIGRPTLNARVDDLFDGICRVWEIAANQPAIFSLFSIPRANTPDSVIVHNWTFASIALAKMIDRRDKLDAAMVAATQNPALRDAVALGRVSRLTAGDPEPFDFETISLENRETFYGAVGQRMLLLRELSQDRKEYVLRGLLDQCFRLGPNGLDAILFSHAFDLSITVTPSAQPCADYVKRLENDRTLRLSLTPLLTTISSSIH